MAKRTYPVEHISFSALLSYLGNPLDFRLKYIDKVRVYDDTPAMVVGRAVHKALEIYYKGSPMDVARDVGLQLIRTAAPNVEMGKTGSVEKIEADYLQTLENYLLENPLYEQMGNLESELIMLNTVKGLPLPVKAVADLVVNDGKMIIDFKKTQSLTLPTLAEDGSVLEPAVIPIRYQIQAVFNKWASPTGKKPDFFVLHEIKTSKNKDGSPQTNVIKIDLNSPESKLMEKRVKHIVKEFCKEISRKSNPFLPNLSSMLDGQNAWNEWEKVCSL